MLRHEKDYDKRLGMIVFRGWVETSSLDFITNLGSNCRKNVAQLKESMDEHGFIGGFSHDRKKQSLILIILSDGRRRIQEGGHRLAAARKSGVPMVYVTVYSRIPGLHRNFWRV